MGIDGVLGNAGPVFEQDLQSAEYNHYVLFTFGIDTELLTWFSAGDTVVICGPNETTEKVKEAATDVDATVLTRTLQSHAKMYLMWSDERITSWLGSFNFTYPGIYENVEWAARFSDTPEYNPLPEELMAGEVANDLTASWQIRQIIELITATVTGGDTSWADSLMQNTEYPYVLLHSHRSNTLKRVLQKELIDVSGTVSVTYYAPFVNARGIELFAQTLTPDIRLDELDLIVRTCRLNEIKNKDTGLSSSHIADFQRKFANFEYQVRSPGDQGDQLRDGGELRPGFAHLKIAVVRFENHEGGEQLVTLLTTANLTKNAWQHDSGNFEIGVLLRDYTENEQLHDFLCSQLPHCYESPRKRELDKAVASTPESVSIEEIWLEDFVKDRLILRDDALELSWSSLLPTINAVKSKVYFRDLLDGSRSPKSVEFEAFEGGYRTEIPSLSSRPNVVVDFIEIDIETPFRPPERRLTDAGIERARSGELSLSDYPGDVVVVDGSIYSVEDFTVDATTTSDVWLRSEYPEPQTIKVIQEPHSQPHLADAFIQEPSTGTVTSEGVGGLAFLEVTIDDAITPRHDQLLLRRPTGGPVEYLGYGVPDEETIRYYLDAQHGGRSIDITIAPPLDRYYPIEDHQVLLPEPEVKTTKAVKTFAESKLMAQPVGDTSIIDDQTAIRFDTALESVPKEAIEVHWGIRGYDRFGEALPLGETLPPQEPHRRLWFRGAITIENGDVDVTLLTQLNSIGILEQPFVSTIRIRDDLLPRRVDINNPSKYDLLSWLVIERSDLLKPAVRETDKFLDVEVKESATDYEVVICPVLDEGELLCLPLVGAHRDKVLQYSFKFRLQGGRPEINYYSPRELKLELEFSTEEAAIELSWSDELHIIEHQDGAPAPTLDRLSSKVNSGVLSRLLFPDDPFMLDDRQGLAIRVREPGLLHLVKD